MKPRRAFRRRVVQVGRRTLGQLFRLKPCEEVNRVFAFLVVRYLVKYELCLHACVFMGNHYHILLSGDQPTVDEFTQDLHSQIARYLNARHRLKDVYVWAPGEPAQIECLDPESAWDDVLYIALNPVAAHIVPRPSAHPGFTVLPSHWGRELTINPPPDDFFKFRARGESPVTIIPQPPPGYEQFGIEELRSKANHEIEMRCRRIRRSGVRFRGYEDVDIFDCPRSLAARRCGSNVASYMPSSRFDQAGDSLFDSCPRYQANDKNLLKQAHDLDRIFWRKYQAARADEKEGKPNVTYPEGTSLYRRRGMVATEPLVDRGWYPLLNYD